MNKKIVITLTIIIAILILGFLRVWTDTNIFGSQKINSYEYFLGCWQGDVRVCDYDPFD